MGAQNIGDQSDESTEAETEKSTTLHFDPKEVEARDVVGSNGCCHEFFDWLDRQWIGIDLSALAVMLVEQRARNELGLMGGVQAIARSDIPKRTDRESAAPMSESKVVLYGTQVGTVMGVGLISCRSI